MGLLEKMSNLSRMKVCVVDAGAIGGFFGARLANGQVDVSAVARGATLQALQSRGWVLESDGQRITVPVRAVVDAAELGPQDMVIIAVKAFALAQVAPLVGPVGYCGACTQRRAMVVHTRHGRAPRQCPFAQCGSAGPDRSDHPARSSAGCRGLSGLFHPGTRRDKAQLRQPCRLWRSGDAGRIAAIPAVAAPG